MLQARDCVTGEVFTGRVMVVSQITDYKGSAIATNCTEPGTHCRFCDEVGVHVRAHGESSLSCGGGDFH